MEDDAKHLEDVTVNKLWAFSQMPVLLNMVFQGKTKMLLQFNLTSVLLAWRDGKFDNEVVEVEVPQRRGEPIVVLDEDIQIKLENS